MSKSRGALYSRRLPGGMSDWQLYRRLLGYILELAIAQIPPELVRGAVQIVIVNESDLLAGSLTVVVQNVEICPAIAIIIGNDGTHCRCIKPQTR